MVTGFEILAAATAGLIGLSAMEAISHKRALRRIPLRIHVAGTRGKSSVTRLLAAGLRGAGIPTAAKTTGTLARMILPDGREVPVFRPSGSNIIEQKRIIKAACALNVDALVIECMALNPLLHWVSENKLIRATHGVITNAREDHLDVMGPTARHVAECLAGMIPVRGKVFTAEAEYFDVFSYACADRESACTQVTEAEVSSITAEELAGFSYLEHAENVALALSVLADIGVDRETALRGMWQTVPDPGALTEHVVDFFSRRIVFVNGFAANDPVSTKRIFDRAVDAHPEVDSVVAVFNLRGDRPDRTKQLAEHTDFWHGADKTVLMGSGAYSFSRLAGKGGFDSTKFVYADFDRVDDIFETIIGVCGRHTLVVGMGNIGGLGLSLSSYFRNRATIAEDKND